MADDIGEAKLEAILEPILEARLEPILEPRLEARLEPRPIDGPKLGPMLDPAAIEPKGMPGPNAEGMGRGAKDMVMGDIGLYMPDMLGIPVMPVIIGYGMYWTGVICC